MFKETKYKIRLYKYILDISEKEVYTYTEDIKEKLELINSSESGVANKTAMEIRNRYLERVFRMVLECVANEKSDIYDCIEKIMNNPEICGYKDMNLNIGILAGYIYAMCYYALTNKIAKAEDCIELNHLQNEIMRQAMLKL